ncbi:hypothetical protein HFN63_35055 [Rhizobium leguminosarum]|uniref:hypothetical protein n=1 Tax=Rhizobium leguminosarum TaxID=384 RepID=UPI001C955C7F|nr:hypothetical protein [Rhizobium leguminosarum]MBY5775198.1 hypothetical protein [Rhizobium leguminosarum]
MPQQQGQQLNATVATGSRLQAKEQLDATILRSATDVAWIELGVENYNIEGTFSGHPSAGIGFRLASGANALDAAGDRTSAPFCSRIQKILLHRLHTWGNRGAIRPRQLYAR